MKEPAHATVNPAVIRVFAASIANSVRPARPTVRCGALIFVATTGEGIRQRRSGFERVAILRYRGRNENGLIEDRKAQGMDQAELHDGSGRALDGVIQNNKRRGPYPPQLNCPKRDADCMNYQ